MRKVLLVSVRRLQLTRTDRLPINRTVDVTRRDPSEGSATDYIQTGGWILFPADGNGRVEKTIQTVRAVALGRQLQEIDGLTVPS